MISRSFICAVLLLCSIGGLLTGCWDTKDINKRLMPVVMGICKEKEEKYRIILQIPSPEKKGSQYLESSSATINKAIDNIRTKSEKSIDLLHIRLFLVCEQTAQNGIGEIIDYAVQANDISIKGLVGIVRGDFDKLMHHRVQSNPELSSYDFFSEQAGWTPNIIIQRLWEAYRDINSYTQDMTIPILSQGTDTLYNFEGAAIMRKDRQITEISSNEVLVYNILHDKYSGGTIEVSDQSSVLIKKADARHHVEWRDSGPRMKSQIKMNVVISENKNHESDDAIKKRLKEMIEARAYSLTQKLRKEKSDAIGFGQTFRKIMTEDQLKDWKMTWFPEMEHEISVDIKVLNSIYLKAPNRVRKPADS